MTRPRKNPGPSGIRTWDLPFSRRTPAKQRALKSSRLAVRSGRVVGVALLTITCVVWFVASMVLTQWAGIAQWVVCWARCPAWCSVAGSSLLWASGRGDVPLGVNMGSDSIPPPPPQKKKKQPLFRMRVLTGSSLFTHVFHRTDSKQPDIHVLDGWMLAIKTHSACTIHEDGMWLPLRLD